jgi:UDP-GlcNAc:undecaprenyl-phosphate GlcNAc-1-phosphate transferase
MSWWVYVTAFLGSMALSAVLVRASVLVSVKVGALDYPDSARKLQSRPIPKLGGIAVAVTFTVIVSPIVLFVEGRSTSLLLLGVLLPGIAMALLGFVDDKRPMNAWLRLVVQAAIALWAWYAGTRITFFDSEWLNMLVFIFWVVAIVNAVNLLDNTDGLAGSTTVITGIAAAIIALLNGQYLVGSLAFALAGVAAGFLWLNWYPAKVYLGDAGAYFMGFLLAILAVRITPVDVSAGWNLLIPLLLLALPLVDMGYVVTRRIAAGIHPFTAGRDHASHSLQRRGLTIPQSVTALQIASIVTCGAAVWITLAF